MGREKALLRIGGETLIERQLRTLRAIGVRDTLVSLRVELAPLLSASLIAGDGPVPALLLDEEEGLGPLAGIVAAMAHSPERHLLVLAVDMPRVRPSFLSRLFSRASPECGVAPRVGGMWEPLCAIYPPGSLELARRHLRSEVRSPAYLLDILAALGRVRALPLSKDATESLRSWNRPEDVGVVLDLSY
jgi:molybdopterin-guanine dinucleotide biosynthesis protein A